MSSNQNHFDLVIVGSGPGGYVGAIRASQLGMKTAIVEKDKLGGICLNWGCIPTKALLKNAELYRMFQKSEEFGIQYDNLRVDFAKIIQRSRDVSDKISRGVGFLMKKNKVSVFEGTGKFTAGDTVEVSGVDGKLKNTLTASRILIATGAHPRALPGD